MRASESQILQACLDWLEAEGRRRKNTRRPFGAFWRQNTGAFVIKDGSGARRFVRCGISGQADITGVLEGLRIEIECKTAKGKLSAAQEAFGRMIRENGGAYVVVRSVTELIAAIKTIEATEGGEELPVVH